MAMTKVKSLQLWCKKMADGYRDVNVKDMTSSWKDGLACCAIIHRFRPDLMYVFIVSLITSVHSTIIPTQLFSNL